LVRGIELDGAVEGQRLAEARLALVDLAVQDLHGAEVAVDRRLERGRALVAVALRHAGLELLDRPGVVDVEVVLFDRLLLEGLDLFLDLRVRGEGGRGPEDAGDDESEDRQAAACGGGERNTLHVEYPPTGDARA